MKNCKKIISLLITLVMIIGVLSLGTFFAFAEEESTEVATYDELVAALADGGKIKLTADITVDTKITAIDGTVIDLNGKTLYINVEDSNYNNVTIKNGNIVLGKDDVHVCNGYFLVDAGKTLVLNCVRVSSSAEGIKGYAVFHLKTGANLDLINSELNISDNEYSAGYIVYAGESTATVDVVDTTVTGNKVNGIVHAATVIENSTFTITNAIEHGINRSGVTITDSKVAISGGTGRGITAQHGPLVINGNSTVTIEDMGEATIELRNNQNLTIANTATVKLDAAVNNTTSGTITGTVILPPMGNNFNAYTGADGLWGEVWGNARESFVIKVLDANGNVMGTTSLNNIGGILNGNVNVTWNLKLDAASNTDEYWTMAWTTAPAINNMPAKVELWVDGVKVSGGDVVLNGPDNIDVINAAVADADGKILSYQKTLAEAVAAAESGATVAILRAGDYTLPEFANKELTFVGVDKANTSITDWVNKGSQGMMGSTVHFKNLTVKGQNENYYGLFHTAGVTYENCNINGLRFLYAPTVSFEDCAFNAEGVEHSFWTYGASDVTVTNCTFTYTDRAVNCYSENGADHELDIAFTDCAFTYAGTSDAPEGAVEINSGSVTSIDLTMDNCTAPAKGAMWFNSQWDSQKGQNTVVKVDGEFVWKPLKGTGTAEDPILINDLADLILFRDTVNTYTQDGSNQFKGKYVKLTADIDLAGINWTPIGTNSVGDHAAFLGIFDGGGHIISNLYINSDGGYLGFFARVGSYAEGITPTVKNIKFHNVNVSSNTTTGHGGSYVGGVIANAGGNSVVSGITVTGNIKVEGYGYVGGIVGHGYPDIDNCHVVANDGSYVKAHYWCAGGIIGYAGEGGTPITNCSVSELDVWGCYGAAAAIAGLLQDGNKVENVSASNVEITSNSDYCMGYIAGNGECSTISKVTMENVTATANGKPITATDAVVKIGDAMYFSLQAAIDAVKAGETIVLLSDVTITTPAYGQNALNHARAVSFTLDLNGKTLSADTGNSVFRFNITNTGATSNVTVTIKNGKVIAGSSTWCALMAAGISTDVKAVMNLEDLTVECSKAGDLGIKAWDYSLINAKNVTVNATNGAGGFYAVGGEIVLDNCTVNQKGLYTAPYLSMAFAVSNGGKLTVNSGTYSAEPTAAAEGNNQGTSHGSWVGGVMSSGGTLIINGGTFSNGNFGDDALATAARGAILADTSAKIEINGGTFNAVKAIIDITNNLGDANKNPSATIKGGTFSADPRVSGLYASNLIKIAEGYVAVKNNDTWNVVEAAAKIGDTYYASFAEAFTAAQNGNTVTLLRDVTLPDILVINKAITLDGNGKKLTSTAGRAINISGANGVTIKNLTINAKGERAINIIQNATNVTIENVTATAYNYTVNVASSAPNAVVAIKNSTLNGLCTVNVSGAGADVTVTGSTINCNDNNTTVGESYAALSLNRDAINGKIIATGCTINVTAGSDSVKARNGAENGLITIDGTTDGVNVVVAIITYEGSNNYHAFYTLASAIEFAKAGDTITILKGEYTVDINVNKSDITIVGETDANGNHLVKIIGKLSVTADDVTVKNLTITKDGSNVTIGEIKAKNVVIDGCKIVGANAFVNCITAGKVTFMNSEIRGTKTYGIQFTGTQGGRILIDNCTISGWTTFTSNLSDVTIKNSKFVKSASNIIRLYGDVAFENTVFNPSTVIDYGTKNCKATFTDCGVSDGSALTNVLYLPDVVNKNISFVINGEKVIVEAMIDNKSYFKFADALKAAKAGDTIKLTYDITTSEIIVIDKAITLDGNGHKLTSTAARAINVSGADGVTIKNLTIDAKGERAINIIQNATNVTIDDVTATAANYTVNVAASAPNAVVVINNSTLNGLCTVNVSGAGAEVAIDNSTINCNDNNTTAGESYAALSLNKDAKGGKIIATGCTINVTDGSDSNKGRNGAENGTVTINGSTDGVIVMVAAITYAGSDNYHAFASLAAAIEFAKAGDTVTLIRDITASDIIVIDKAITLDGNGKTLTSTAGRAINVATEGQVTIKNLTIDAKGERAINVITKPATLTIDNVTATAANYTVNVVSSAGAAKVTINKSTLNGLCTVNVSGAGAEVAIDNSTINCNDNNTTAGESYAALCLNKAAVGGSIIATNTTVNVTAGSDSEKGRNGAEDGTVIINGSTEGVTVTVAVITYPGSDYYYGFTSIADAIEFAKAGDTVTLIRDITASDIIVIDKAITLDGNNHKLTSTAARAINVSGADGATIKNLTVTTTGERAINVIQGATNLTLDNVTASAANYTVNIAASAPNAVVAIKNSTLNGLCTVNVSAEGAQVTVDNSTINCNDNNTTQGEAYAALSLNKEAVGGSIVATNSIINVAEGSDSHKGRNGAEFGTVIINGSTEDVLVIVAVITYAGQSSYHGFASLAEAIEFAKAGDTITLIRDVTTSATISINKNITINANNKTITYTGTDRAIQITGGTVVINDLTVTMTNAPEGSRGINLYNGGTNAAIDVTLNNVTVNGGKAYAVNIGGGKDNKLTINGSALTGYAAINVHTSSVNHTIVVDGSVLNGKNHNNNYHFGTVVVDGTNAHTLKITNTTVTTENLAGVTNKYYQVIVGANCAYEVCDGISVAVRNVYNKNDGLYYIGLQSAIDAAKAGDTIVLLADIETSETFTVPAGKKITLDLNGKTISGTDTTNKSFSLITNKGELTITGNGKITLKATQDTGYNRSSSVISNTVGGKLIVESGLIEHLGGHTMAYAIDNLTNGKGTYAETVINGGTIKSSYVGIRQFLNGVDADNILTVNGGTVTGNNTSIFFQDPSKNCNSGKLVVGENATLGNRIYVSGTAGTPWDVEISVSAQALGTNGIVTDEIPETSVIKEVNGVYGFVQSVASVDGIGYATLAEAYAAAQDGDEVKILVAGTYKVPTGKNITITGAVDGVVFDNIGAHGMGGASVTFNNVTFNYAANSTYSGLQHAGNLVYNNCIFNGQVFLYGASETFNNCTFNNTGDNYNVWTYGAKAVEFNGCTFNSDGKAVLIYTEGADTFNTVTVTDSTFKASAAVDGKAAIEMDSSLSAGIKLTVTNSTATGFGTGNVSGNSLWNNKKGNNTDANNDITVVVDDTQVLAPVTFVAKIGNIGYTTIDAAIAAAQAGDTVTLLADTTLNETITIDKKITIDLNGNTVTGADGAIVFNVKAETTIENGTIKGNKSGTSSGLIDIYANLTIDGVTVETSKINALRFKAGDCTATLTNCNVIGAFKGYGGSVWNIVSGTYKAASTAINDQLNGTASISGGTFYYEIAAEECAPGYAVVNNGDGTYGVKYAPVAFVDANNNGTLDDGEAVYGSLEAIFKTYQTGDVYIVLTDNAVIKTQVDTDADAKYYLNTNVAEGVTVEFAFADDWNYIQKMYVGENVTIKAPYLLVWTELDVHGTIITDYLYIQGGDVLVAEGAEVTATTGDATIQVKNGATLTVNGTVNTAILNVWAGDSKLVVNGANAKVNASWIDIWDGTPSVSIENGATLAVDSIKASRGGEIKVDNATLDADKVELGHNGTSAGNLTVNNGTVTGEIKLTVVGSTFTGPEGMNVTTDVDGYVVVYENGTYSLAVAVASINGKNYASLQAAINAAQNGDVIALLWKEGDAPIAMNGAVYGKTVTITGTATVDWSKGFLFVGRGGAGNGTVIFDNANLTSASDSKSFGIHVSGREKNTNNKYDGTLVIKNSTIELDYLINKGSITLVNSTLTVKNGFSIGGRPASETESGADATATITLTNNSIVVVDNHNGMGLGYEAIGVMNIDATSAFECTQNFLVTAKGTMNIAGTVKIAGKLTNNGKINLTAVAATLQSNECGNVSTNLADYIVAYADGAYKLVERNYVAQVGDKKYESFAEALAAVNAGDTIKLLADVEVSGTLILNQGITLDLNGKTLTTYFLVAFKGNHVIDSTRGKGLLKIAEDNAMLSADNANMAVYTGKGYKFASVKTTNYKVENVTDTGFTVKFRPGLGSDVQEYLNTTDEATASGMQIIVRLSWISDGIAQYQDSVYNAEMMATMYNSTNTSQTGSLSLTVKNVGNYENLEATLILKSDAGIQISQHMYTFNETTSAE